MTPRPPTARPPGRPTAEFVGSFPDPLTPFDPPLPEVAFLGRSNVGKSSLLNALVGAKGLAKVSSTPGKTQTMNVFRIGPQASGHGPHDGVTRGPRPEARGPNYYLIDLPGYGYARTSKTERARFASLIEGFLTLRPTITGLVWLLDIRHDPSAEDRAMAELLGERSLPVLAVLTKADKLGTEGRRTRVREIARALHLDPTQIEVTSSKEGDGIDALRDAIASALHDPGE
ncbi:MAG: GTP-binding protein [Gemmatimonadetes bacterium]|nr:GTP-binding protein [Gemmatimonadota bacterium]